MVGNETTLRAEMTVPDLIALIQKVKRSEPSPCNHGRNLDGLDRPSRACLVGRLHRRAYSALLGGFDASHAVDHTIEFYDKLRQMHPGKRIVIAEFGWPSAGYNFHKPTPAGWSRHSPARFCQPRRSLWHRLQHRRGDRSALEDDGRRRRPLLGLFDASRQPKFPWTGAITDPDYLKSAGLAVLVGLLLSLPILAMAGVTLRQALLLAVSANVVGAWFAAIVAFWKGHYFVPGAAFALGLGIILLVPLIAIAMARMEEIAAIAFGRPPRRLSPSPPLAPEVYAPKSRSMSRPVASRPTC